MKLEWKDATSYSQGQRGNVPQTAWEAKIHGCRIWVSCNHRHYPGSWVLTCHPLDIDCKELGPISMTSEQARDKALSLVIDAAEEKSTLFARVSIEAASVNPLHW